jgi:hypothetical protein
VLSAMVRWLQLGDGQATGSNPAGIELGTKASFRDKSKVVAWSTVSSCTGEEGLRRAVLTMASVKARSTWRASLAAEALRSSGYTVSASLRSSAGSHGAAAAPAPGRRGPAFPCLLRLPPRTAVRLQLLGGLWCRQQGAASGSSMGAPPSSSLPSSPSFLPSLVAAHLGAKPMGGAVQGEEAGVRFKGAAS